ncbi:uncharacterized protein LOC144708538 [Wolffia australiana]
MAAEIKERDAQRLLIDLIRDFASKQSQGEKRISELKKQLNDIKDRLEAANDRLAAAKQSREAAENILRGSEVELSMADASVHALEARTHLLQEQVSKVSSDFSCLKNEEETLRDKFFMEMSELNKKIRNFRELELLPPKKNNHVYEGNPRKNELAENVKSQLRALEEKYQEQLYANAEANKTLTELEKRAVLCEFIIEETTKMKDLSRQTAESEQVYAALGGEIQRRFTCPSCKVNNVGFWDAR